MIGATDFLSNSIETRQAEDGSVFVKRTTIERISIRFVRLVYEMGLCRREPMVQVYILDVVTIQVNFLKISKNAS